MIPGMLPGMPPSAGRSGIVPACIIPGGGNRRRAIPAGAPSARDIPMASMPGGVPGVIAVNDSIRGGWRPANGRIANAN
jgi:hypothetical protein